MSKIKYCWLNNNGRFSESWNEETHNKHVDQDIINHGTKAKAKLIKYECLNDDEFEFNSLMKMK